VARILVTGAGGQIGSELVPRLRELHGDAQVLATDMHPLAEAAGPSRPLDCTDAAAVRDVVSSFRPTQVYHLAALLSAVGERTPNLAWTVNLDGLRHMLEACRETGAALFTPSSIAAFGPETPRDPTPQDTLQRPTSIYGITKVAGELLCDYYHTRFGVDTRGVRYPGLVSWAHPPGGGTTDFAVDIYFSAVREGRYRCFVGPETQLDMMYMDDAIRAAIEVMEADPARLRHRNAFNITAMQVTPLTLAASIREHIPGFELDFDIDPQRQRIADSWPRRIDDSAAREEWGWRAEWTLESMTEHMITSIRSLPQE
jgi:nucleoside-diphosphate-sugar epimerase